MKRVISLALVLALSACGEASHSGAGAQATLAPTTVFRDALLLAAVKAKLAGEDIDSTLRVRVGVRDGAVQLSGTVGSAGERSRAVATTKSVTGVRSVDDRMTIGHVGPGVAKRTADLAVVAGVESAIFAQTGINVSSVRVAARDGIVTLSGVAPTEAVKSTLIAAAKGAPGVRNVVVQIAVKK